MVSSSMPKSFSKKVTKIFKKFYQVETPRLEIEKIGNVTNNSIFNHDSIYKYSIDDEYSGLFLIRKGIGCQLGGCLTNEKGEPLHCTKPDPNQQLGFECFYYFVSIDTSNTIDYVEITDYPIEYGYEITNKGWLKQFQGYRGDTLQYGKNIDAVSGATISANSLITDLQLLYKGFAVMQDSIESVSTY